MQGFETIINSILTLGLAMLIGFTCVKTGYLKAEIKDSISKIIIRVTLPLLMITSLTKLTLDHSKVVNSIITVIAAYIIIGVLYFAGVLCAKLFKLEKTKAAIHICMTCFGNVVFIAYPLIQALYGDEGLLYAALFAFANDCWLWTVGVYTMSKVKGAGGSFTANLKRLITPATVGFLISLFMLVTGLRFTGIIKDVLTNVGGITTYLSMLFIGMTLAMVDFRHIYKRISLFALTAVKMLIIPALLVLALRYVPIDPLVKAVLVLQTGIPTSTVLVILTTDYGCDTVYSAEGVFITTLLSIGTLPLIYRLMQIML
ncbi:MAG: AEC family transporter [bacterium]|nr:AEC family transporter [bacterium]